MKIDQDQNHGFSSVLSVLFQVTPAQLSACRVAVEHIREASSGAAKTLDAFRHQPKRLEGLLAAYDEFVQVLQVPLPDTSFRPPSDRPSKHSFEGDDFEFVVGVCMCVCG